MRCPNWEAIYLACIEDARERRFTWGTHDCALFACNVVQKITGLDLAEPFRGKYDSADGAARIIKDFAGSDLEALAEKRAAECGLAEITPLMAQRGDVVLVRTPTNNKALGIVAPDARYVYCAGPKGLTRVQMSDWLRAWRVA